MGFKKNKKSDITEKVVKNDRGEEVHVLNGPDGTVEVKRVHMKDFLPTGEEWCPHCHVQCDHYDEDEYFKCPECGWTITDWGIEEWGGHPTEAASHEDDFGTNFEDAFSNDD